MAAALLRSAVRATTKRSPTFFCLSPRSLSSSSIRHEEQTVLDRKKTGFDYHTVEDLHGMSAAEILSGPKEDPKMRHFTGMLLFGFHASSNL